MFAHLKKFFAATAVALAVLPAMAADTLKIGVLPGVYADAIHAAAKDAKAQGLEVKVVEFTDWTTPNVAVGAGGLGDLAIRYGYQRFDTQVMLIVIVVLIALVTLVQASGDRLAHKLRSR